MYKQNLKFYRVIKSNKNMIKSSIFMLLNFLYVFNPPFFKIDSTIIVEIIAIIYLLYVVFRKKFVFAFNSLDKKLISIGVNFIPFVIYISVMMLYYLLTYSTSYNVFVNAYIVNIRIFFRLVIVCAAYYVFVKNELLFETVHNKTLYNISVIQLIFVFLTLIFPAVRNFCLGLIIQNGSEIYSTVTARLLSRRGYGLAENLYDGFGYILALILCALYNKWLTNQKKSYIIVSLMLVAACVLNARSGVVLSIIGIFTCTVLHKKTNRLIEKITIMLCSIFIFAWGVYNLLTAFLPDNLEWINEGFKEIASLLNNERSGTFAMLVDNITLPENIIFGEGASPEALQITFLDMGYIQCIWRYGLIGTVLLFVGYVRTLLLGIRCGDDHKSLFIAYGIIFFTYLFKIFSIYSLGGNLIIITQVINVIVMTEKSKDAH